MFIEIELKCYETPIKKVYKINIIYQYSVKR